MHFHDTHTSLPITRAEDHKRAWLKVEEGVRPSLESRRRLEEENARLEAEDETSLVEEAKLKSEEEDYAWLEARLKAEEEEEDLRMKAEEEAQLTE